MNHSISIAFGTPEHGWLPVSFRFQDFELNFAASDVLNDPIEELYNAITKLCENYTRQIIWWLEPAAYYFDLDKNGQEITLTISETDNIHYEKTEKRVLQTIIGDENGILKPLVSALKDFCSQTYPENHWPYRMDKNKIQSL